MPIRMLKRLFYLLFAGVFFGLGVLGVLVPGIPATPFLLLTSYCLVRSWPQLNAMLLRSRLFGPLLLDWQVHRGVRKRVKWVSILIVAVAVGTSIAFFTQSAWGAILVGSAACVGVFVIYALPTIPETEPVVYGDSESA